MLLHKPAGSQCGFYNIKQTAFLSRCSVSVQRKPPCTGTRCDTAWAVGMALSMCVCMWTYASTVQHLTLPPFTHMPPANCLLRCKTNGASLRLDRSIMVQFKCLYLKQEATFVFILSQRKNKLLNLLKISMNGRSHCGMNRRQKDPCEKTLAVKYISQGSTDNTSAVAKQHRCYHILNSRTESQRLKSQNAFGA